MNTHNLIFIFFNFYWSIYITSTKEICDESKCLGPLQYYEELGCKPIYKSPDNCCPYRYDCDHLSQISLRQCYVNGHEYDIGDVLSTEDSERCDSRCTCIENPQRIAVVACEIYDYDYPPPSKPNCYYPRNVVDCGPVKPICPENPEDRPKCEVNGRIYQDGEYFVPASEPRKSCYCGPGYTGENIKPYCTEPKFDCATARLHHLKIHNKCAPLPNILINCTSSFRCQADDDYVIKAQYSDRTALNSHISCRFGNLTMNYGDELNQVPFLNFSLKCICEVGPALTCRSI